MKVRGISLVPDTKTWPQSSLAQMVAWFAEYWSVDYVTSPESIKVETEQPIWFFATAIQIMNLHEKGQKIPLPPGSLIIETGGTKGRKKEFTKSELYGYIEEIFSVPQAKIISEYSMCELACQAYDFMEEGRNIEERCYRFPFWVENFSIHALSQAHREGFGSLLIKDPLRIDYPLRNAHPRSYHS